VQATHFDLCSRSRSIPSQEQESPPSQGSSDGISPGSGAKDQDQDLSGLWLPYELPVLSELT